MTINETLKQIEQEQQKEDELQNNQSLVSSNNEVKENNHFTINEISNRYNASPKPIIETKQSNTIVPKTIAPRDRTRYTLDDMSNVNRTALSRTMNKFSQKTSEYIADYRNVVAPINNSTMKQYEQLLGINSPQLNALRDLNSNVQGKMNDLGAITALSVDGVNVAKNAFTSQAEQRDRRTQRTHALASRASGNIHSGLRAGASIGRLGNSLSNAHNVSKLVFGDGTKTSGLPLLMDIIEKSTRPITKGGVKESIGGNVLSSIDSEVGKKLTKPLVGAIDTISSSFGSLHSVISPLTKSISVYSQGMAHINNFLFGGNFVKNTLAKTFRSANIDNLSSMSMASLVTKPLVDVKTMAIGKIMESGAGGGILAMYGSAFADMGISIITRKIGAVIGNVVTKVVKSIRDSGKAGLRQRVRPRELKFKETTTDEILKRYGGNPEMAETTVNQLMYMKGSTLEPKDSALYLATDAIRRNTSPIAGILAFLENSNKSKEVHGSKFAQNKLAEMTSTGGGNLAVGADMVGPTEKFLNWIGDKANVAKLLLPSANIANTLRGISTTKMLKDIEANRYQENLSINSSRDLGVNLDDYTVIHTTPAKLVSKGRNYESKNLILLGSQLQVQQFLAKEVLTIRKANGIKEQSTLTDEVFTQKGLAQSLDNVLGYIPMYALLSRTIGTGAKAINSLLPSNIDTTKEQLKHKALTIGKNFASDNAKYFTSERDLLNQLKDMYRDKVTGELSQEHANKFTRHSASELYNQFYVYEYPKLFQEQTGILDKSLSTQIQILLNVESLNKFITHTSVSDDKSYLNRNQELKVMNSRTGEFETLSQVREMNNQLEDDIKKLVKRKDGSTSLLDFAFKVPKDLILKGIDVASGGKMMNAIETELMKSNSVQSILRDKTNINDLTNTQQSYSDKYNALLAQQVRTNYTTTSTPSYLTYQDDYTIQQTSIPLSHIKISDLSSELFFTLLSENTANPTNQTNTTNTTITNRNRIRLSRENTAFANTLEYNRSMIEQTMMNYTVIGEIIQTAMGNSATFSRRQQEHERTMETRFNEVSNNTGLTYSELNLTTLNVNSILNNTSQSIENKHLTLSGISTTLLQIISRETTAIRIHLGANQLINRNTEASRQDWRTTATDIMGHIPLFTLAQDLTNFTINQIQQRNNRRTEQTERTERTSYQDALQQVHSSQQENKITWSNKKKQIVANMTPHDYFKEMKNAVKQDTSIMDLLKDKFVNKLQQTRVVCCNNGDEFQIDDERDKKNKRKRRTRKTRRTRSRSKFSKIKNVGGKLTKSVGSKLAGLGGALTTGAKFIGKKFAGAGLASLLGPIGIALYGAYSLYDTYNTAKDLYNTFVPSSDEKNNPKVDELVKKQIELNEAKNTANPATDEAKNIANPALEDLITNMFKSFNSEIEKLIANIVKSNAINTNRMVNELHALQKVVAMTPNVNVQTSSNNNDIIEQPFNFNAYFNEINHNLVSNSDKMVSSFLTK